MDKYARLRARVVENGIVPPDRLHEPHAAAWTDITARALRPTTWRASATAGSRARSNAASAFRGRCRWSSGHDDRSGGTIDAARAALQDGVSANLAGGTHHAFRDRGEGYCVFNDVAVAATTMLETGRVRQVAVIDLDVHQGNGTAAIFEHDPRVFTCSLHGAANFPFHKERSDLDVPLPDGTGDDEYMAHLAAALDVVLADGT